MNTIGRTLNTGELSVAHLIPLLNSPACGQKNNAYGDGT